MNLHVLDLLRLAIGLLAGGGIGLLFGRLQNAALERHERREREGRLGSGWSLMPGAGARVAYLLIALVVVQLVCPMLFADGVQWAVSAGLLAGHGASLWQRLRRRRMLAA